MVVLCFELRVAAVEVVVADYQPSCARASEP